MAKAQAQKPQTDDFFTKVAKLKPGAKAGILVAALVVIIGGFYYIYYMPFEEESARLSQDVNTLRQQVDAEQASIDKHKPIAQYVQPVEMAYEFLKNYMTTENEIPRLIQTISDLGSQSGIKVTLFAPKAAVPMPDYAEIEFTMNLQGTFLNIVKFFYSLSQMERIINIKSVVMDTPTMGDNLVMTLNVRCIGSTYRVLTADEIKQMATAPK